MNTAFSLAPLFRSSIGFDRFNDLFETALRSDVTSYPPYNVEKHGEDEYRIVIAAAGFQDGDLDIQVERDMLTISSARREKSSSESVQYLHQGIAQRAFKLSFRLADFIEVKGASLQNGLLHVDLKRHIPEEAKPRRINIGVTKPALVERQAA